MCISIVLFLLTKIILKDFVPNGTKEEAECARKERIYHRLRKLKGASWRATDGPFGV